MAEQALPLHFRLPEIALQHLSSGYFRQGTISFNLLPWNSAHDFNHSRPTVWIALSSLSPVLYQSISMLKWILCFISPDSIWIYYYTLFKLSTLQYTTTNKTIVAVPPGPWDPANKKYSWRSRGKEVSNLGNYPRGTRGVLLRRGTWMVQVGGYVVKFI